MKLTYNINLTLSTNNKKRRGEGCIFFLFSFILIQLSQHTCLMAQNEVDALRYSQISYGGTSRYMSMGGAFGGLGGDASVLSTNPAGIAVYRKSEFTFTPSFYNRIDEAMHYGNSTTDNKYNINFSNIGWVSVSGNKESGWVSSAFGIAYNRLNNFHSRFIIEGVNEKSSLIDVYMNDLTANGGVDVSLISESPQFAFGANLAWQTYLIDTSGGPAAYYSALPNYGELQRNTVTGRGSMGETALTYGGNYNNRFYIGATLGIENIRYLQESTHDVYVTDDDSTTFLSALTLSDKLTTSGVGYNFKLGMIYRIHDYVRLGGAIHTPAFFRLHDQWSSKMESDFKDGNNYEYSSPQGDYDYLLTTPFRAIGSMSVLFGKIGLISADYEYVNYASARLRSGGDGYGFSNENSDIQNKYTATGNIRIGTEWRFPPFSFRGGYALYGNPYNSNIDNDGGRQSYSIGLGIKESEFFIDFAYVLTQTSEKYFIYAPQFVDASNINSSAHTFLATLGFRF